MGSSFSVEENLLSYKIYVNKNFVGELDYNKQQIIIHQEYFNDYAQKFEIDINKKVKLYASGSFKMYPVKNN